MYPFIHLSKVPNWIGENATKADDDLQHKCQEYTGEEGYYFFEVKRWLKGTHMFTFNSEPFENLLNLTDIKEPWVVTLKFTQL
jgi:hypothetical protein